jgi:hypothetical protein
MNRLVSILAMALAVMLALSPAASAAWSWPLRGEVITPYRNGDDPYAAGQHRGIDIAGPIGASVGAAAAGVVRFAGVAGSSGLTVSVRTTDGRFDTSYLHLSVASVHLGEQVTAGQRLGAVGTSGQRSASVPHLHFGVRQAESRQAYLDPLGLLDPYPPTSVPERDPKSVTGPVEVPALMRAPAVGVAPAVDPPHAGTVGQRAGARVEGQDRVLAPRRRPMPVGGRQLMSRGSLRSMSVLNGAHGPAGDVRRVPIQASPRESLGARRRMPVGKLHRARTHVPELRPRHALGAVLRRHAMPAADRRPDARTLSTVTDGRVQGRGVSLDRPPVGDAARDGGSGLYAGWVVACLGLLAAAAAAGTGPGRERVSKRGAWAQMLLSRSLSQRQPEPK